MIGLSITYVVIVSTFYYFIVITSPLAARLRTCICLRVCFSDVALVLAYEWLRSCIGTCFISTKQCIQHIVTIINFLAGDVAVSYFWLRVARPSIGILGTVLLSCGQALKLACFDPSMSFLLSTLRVLVRLLLTIVVVIALCLRSQSVIAVLCLLLLLED